MTVRLTPNWWLSRSNLKKSPIEPMTVGEPKPRTTATPSRRGGARRAPSPNTDRAGGALTCGSTVMGLSVGLGSSMLSLTQRSADSGASSATRRKPGAAWTNMRSLAEWASSPLRRPRPRWRPHRWPGLRGPAGRPGPGLRRRTRRRSRCRKRENGAPRLCEQGASGIAAAACATGPVSAEAHRAHREITCVRRQGHAQEVGDTPDGAGREMTSSRRRRTGGTARGPSGLPLATPARTAADSRAWP